MKVAVVEFVVFSGPLWIPSAGAAVSTVHVRASVFWFPAASVAARVNVCWPSARLGSCFGESPHGVAPALSSLQLTVGAGLPPSLAVKAKAGVLSLLKLSCAGPPVICAVGSTGRRPTTRALLTAPRFPAAS